MSDTALLRLGAAFDHELRTLRRLEDEDGDYDARNSCCTRACSLMRAIHRHPAPTTVQGVAVKLRAVVFDMTDFHTRFRGTDVAEQQLARLERQVTRLAKAEGGSPCAS